MNLNPNGKSRYKTNLSTTDDFAYVFDPQGRSLYASPRLLKVYAILGLAIALGAVGSPDLQAWTMKKAPLMTRWAAKVDPAHPLPEYPRPQLVRKDWLNLNGIWEYQPGAEEDAVPVGTKLASKILVPFPVESALSGVMEHHDRLWYRRTFEVPAHWKGRNVILNFGAVDFESEVFVNGKSAGVHRGGYDPFCFDITPFLKDSGSQELIVRVFDATDAAGEPRGKQTLIPHGVDYTCTTGIWQTVWIEPVAPDGVKNLNIAPDVDHGRVNVTVQTYRDMANEQVTVQVKDGGTVIGSGSGAPNVEISVPVPDAKLWSPDSPFLYDLAIFVTRHNAPVDAVTSYFGMRKVEVAAVGGMKRILLNGKFVFQFGALDQGFWPDGVYTPPSDDAMRNDIQMAKAFGLNLLRKHIKVEPARWYYWTDHLGMIVWQDMPSPNTYMSPTEPVPPVDKAEFQSELVRMVEILRNVPSIVQWEIFNEGQGEFDSARLVSLVKAIDPTRLVDPESGGNHPGIGDVVDSHGPPISGRSWVPSATQASVIGEFGSVGVSEPGHRWHDGKGGPIDPAAASALVGAMDHFAPQIEERRDKYGLSGVDLVQLTDVEGEQNGLLTYDRLPKVDPVVLRPDILLTVPRYDYRVVVPTSESESQSWKYTLQEPGKDWLKKDFDDSKWQNGKSGFGGEVPNHGILGTPWRTHHIWLRRHFNPGALTPDQLDQLCVTDYHDDDISVYLNGVPGYTALGYQVDYESKLLSSEARRAIVPSADNVLAVEGSNEAGGQYVDAGLSIRTPAKP